jgi:glycosyltransferase involved in cell wall biosynthesis
MKIALLVHCFFPGHFYGTEAYTLSLAREFRAAGHDATVISATFQGEPRQASPIAHYEWDGVPVISVDKNAWPHRSVAETYDQPALHPVYRELLGELRPDILHVCHLINHTAVAVDVASDLGIPVYATLTDFFGFCLTNKLESADGSLCAGPSPSRANCVACHLKAAAARPDSGRAVKILGTPFLRPASSAALAAMARIAPNARAGSLRPADIVNRPDRLRASLARYAGAIAPSRFLHDAYRSNGFPAPLHVSHFGVDIERELKPASPDPGRVRLGYVGQLASHKGVDVLLSALKAAGRPNIDLTIWGDESQDPGHAAHLRALSAGLNVRFAGTVAREALAGVLAGIDALAIPSVWYENSPLILLQALATHTPVIVSDVQGLTEFIAPGRSGLTFPRGDAAALGQILCDLSADTGRLARMSHDTAYPRTSRDMAMDVLEIYKAAPAANGTGLV